MVARRIGVSWIVNCKELRPGIFLWNKARNGDDWCQEIAGRKLALSRELMTCIS